MEKSSIGRMMAVVVFIMATVIGTSLWSYLSPAYAATVSIDGAVEYQTIDGFGGAETFRLPGAAIFPIMFDTLGASVLRFYMYPYVESDPDVAGDKSRDNDNNDPNVINWSGVNLSSINAFAPLLQDAQSRGVKIIGVVLSPPAWMKDNNLVETGGNFLTAEEDELVEFITIWIKGMETYYGVHIDSVSIQNEPSYSTTYDSCVYTTTQYLNAIKALGAKFAAEGITTEIHAPDTMTFYSFNQYTSPICADATAKGYVDTLSSHMYGFGGGFDSDPDSIISDWQTIAGIASSCGKDLWMTEYGNLDNNIYKGPLGAFYIVQHIHNALVYGNVTCFLEYQIYKAANGADEIVMNDGTMSKKGYLLKHYFRYVRPGAIRVSSVSNDADIMATAFKHEVNNNFTIVVINRDTSNKIIDFNMSNLNPISSLNVYRTSATENSVDLGSISVSANSFTYTLPSESITTFTDVVGGDSSGDSTSSGGGGGGG